MSDTVAEVRITGDATGGIAASQQAGAAVAEATALMKAKLAEAGMSARAAMTTVAESMRGVGTATEAAATKVAASAGVIAGATERMKVAAEGVRGHYERAAGGMEMLNRAFLAVAAVMAGGALFKETVGDTIKLTSEVRQLSKSLGISLEAASGMHVALNKFGISTDTVTTAGQKLARQMKMNEKGINAMGVETRDAQGHFRNLQEIMMSGIEALRGYKEGTDRTMAGQALFGRGAGDVAALLKLSNAELAEGAETAKRLGLVIGTDGVEAMMKYKVAQNEMRETFEAVKVAIGNAVLPALIEFGDWLKDHGAAVVEGFRAVIHLLSEAISACATVVHALWEVVSTAVTAIGDIVAAVIGRDAVNHFLTFQNVLKALAILIIGVKTTVVAGIQMIGAAIENLIGWLKQLGAVAAAVLGFGSWGDVISGWSKGIDAIAGKAEEAVARVKATVAKGQAEIDALNAKPRAGGGAAGGSGLSGTRDFTPAAKGGGKRKGGKAKGGGGAGKEVDRVTDWEQGLSERKLALDAQNDADNTFREMSKAEEAAYWRAILARADLSAKERKQVQGKYLAAALAEKKEHFQAMIAAEQAEMQEARTNGDRRVEIARQIEGQIARAYGAESKEAQQAKRERIRVEQEVAAQRIEAAKVASQRIADAEVAVVDVEQAAAEHRVAMGRETQGQLIAAERAFEDRRFAIKRQALVRNLALLAQDPTASPAKKAEIDKAIEALEAGHQKRMTDLTYKAELQRTSRMRGGIQSVSSAWGGALARMATLQAGFAGTIQSLWQGLVGSVTQMLAQMIEQYLAKWLASLLIKKAAGKAAAAGDISAEVAKAGAGGTASMAAAPFPMNMGAPAFGSAMAAAAAAFAPAASFDVGAWNLPGDMVAQVHKGEMIIPAPFADDLRRNGGSVGGGDTYHIHAVDGDSMRRLLRRNASAVGEAAKLHRRNGGSLK